MFFKIHFRYTQKHHFTAVPPSLHTTAAHLNKPHSTLDYIQSPRGQLINGHITLSMVTTENSALSSR